MSNITVGLLLFADLTQLDFTGPYEVFRKTPGITTHVLAATLDPVRAETGLRLLPDTTMAEAPPLDVICVPGGPGVNALMEDAPTLAFLRSQAAGARYVTSVCTGALVLGAAGLLRGRRATTHWSAHDLLARFDAIPTVGRVVRDGRVVTGGGVTAGIDFALALVAEMLGPEVAQRVQLQIEYAPAPPFDCGTPETAPGSILADVRARGAAMRAAREAITARAAQSMPD
ncbi:MAG: DJ-1/PfpI family protein [Rhodospirillales bacterium]|nr:DJ-1/PfpI family protein [Rhodospirillales bacterium]